MARKPAFSKFIRDARLRRGLTAAEVADEIGVSQSSIYFWEADRTRPRDETLTALCKILKFADPGNTRDDRRLTPTSSPSMSLS